MQFKIRYPTKVPKREFKVNKSFKTKSEITKRTTEISEAFGIGVDEEKEFDKKEAPARKERDEACCG